jgi:hypothetical protein
VRPLPGRNWFAEIEGDSLAPRRDGLQERKSFAYPQHRIQHGLRQRVTNEKVERGVPTELRSQNASPIPANDRRDVLASFAHEQHPGIAEVRPTPVTVPRR